jgi:thiamine kinase
MSSHAPETDADRRHAEAEVRERLATHAVTAAFAAGALVPIYWGLSNHAWRAEADGRRAFVRLARPGLRRLGADHEHESRILPQVVAAGLAPPVLRCEPSSRLLVTEWVEVARDAMTPRTEDVTAAAAVLARLHALDAGPVWRRLDFAAQARVLEATLPLATAEDSLAGVAARIFERLGAAAGGCVPCHHDLNPLNLLTDAGGRCWLVDWEYAGLGDPVYDLASYASQHALDAAGRRRLARAYVRAGGRIDAGRLALAAWAFDYVQWLWYRAALAGGQGPQDRELARQRAGRLAVTLRKRAPRLLRCNNPPF